MMANPYFVLASIKKESKRKTHAKFINLIISTQSDLSQMSRKTQMLFYSVLYTIQTHVACEGAEKDKSKFIPELFYQHKSNIVFSNFSSL